MSSWLWDSSAKFVATESFRRLPFILAFALISALVIRTTLLLDTNKHVFSHKPGKCRQFQEMGTGGAAYFENIESLRYLFASDGFHRLVNSTYNAGIYFTKYPKNNVPKQPKKQEYGQKKEQQTDPVFIKSMAKLKFERLSINANDELLNNFNPLGIASYIEGSIAQKKYRLFLYVVNARLQKPNRVEVFLVKVKERTLVHQFTVEDPSFTSLSDIVVLSAGRFLVSNVFYYSNKWLQLAEFMTQREYGSLLMYNGKKVVQFISGLQTPNGLVWDSDKRHLYVSLTNAETVKIFSVNRDMTTSEITQLNLMSSPDQMYLHKSSGDLWLTAHPVTHQLLSSLFTGFQSKTASHVLRIRFQGKMESWVITEPLANNGTLISTASSITLVDDYLLIGSRIEKAISCHLNDPLYA